MLFWHWQVLPVSAQWRSMFANSKYSVVIEHQYFIMNLHNLLFNNTY